MKAMLEQPNGLARRILAKAGSDPSRMLERTDAFIRRQPTISGDAGQVLGRNLEALVNKAMELQVRPPRALFLPLSCFLRFLRGVLPRASPYQPGSA